MLRLIATSGLVLALAGCGDDFKPAPARQSTQTKTEGRAARAVTARYNCTHIAVRGSPALVRELERRGYCETSEPVLTVVVRPGPGSLVTYGNSSAAKL